MDIIDKVKKIIAEQLCISPDDISDTANIIEDLGADSLDIVELLMTFEDEFKDQIGGGEIPESDAEKLTTVSKVIEYIKEKSKK